MPAIGSIYFIDIYAVLMTIARVTPKRISLESLSDYKTSAYALIAANSLPVLRRALSPLGYVLHRSRLLGRKRRHRRDQRPEDAHLLSRRESPALGRRRSERQAKSRAHGTLSRRFRENAPLANQGSKFFFMPFFIVHYGMFCFVHGVFIFAIFGHESGGFGPFGGIDNFSQVLTEQHLWLCVAALAASHIWSFFVNYIGRGEYRRTAVPIQMFQPYGRIVILHIAILIGGFIAITLGSNIFVLVLLSHRQNAARPEPALLSAPRTTCSPERAAHHSARSHHRWDGRIDSHAADSRRNHIHRFIRHRMVEAELPGVKRNRSQPLIFELLAKWMR